MITIDKLVELYRTNNPSEFNKAMTDYISQGKKVIWEEELKKLYDSNNVEIDFQTFLSKYENHPTHGFKPNNTKSDMSELFGILTTKVAEGDRYFYGRNNNGGYVCFDNGFAILFVTDPNNLPLKVKYTKTYNTIVLGMWK